MNRWLPWIGSAALVAVGGGAVYLSTVGLDDAQAATVDYITQAAEQTDVTVTSAATGSVASAESYSLAFGEAASLDALAAASSSTWTVDEVLVAVGDHVSAGQVLAVADTSDLETEISEVTASLERADITLSEAESDLESASDETQAAIDSINSQLDVLELQLAQAQDTRDEAADGSAEKIQAKITIIDTKASMEEVEDQKAELKAERSAGYPELTIAVGVAEQSVADLEQELEELQEQLELAEIVAPVDGVVSELSVTAGFTAPSSSAAVVVDSDTLEVVASVVESDIGSLIVGQTAAVSIDAVEQDVSGVVTSVVPTTTGSTSSVVSYPVTVTLTDPDDSVLAGMTTDVEIVLEEATGVVAVPVTALEGRDGDYMVQVVNDDGSIEMRSVTVGLVTETTAEIQSGLAVGEEVVIGTAADRTTSEDDDSSSAFDVNALSGSGGGERPAGPPPGA